jgi:hypothetical protein
MENPAKVPRKLRPRPDKVTFKDRDRWNEELRTISATLSVLKQLPAHRRPPTHKQDVADIEHRLAELRAWLDGGTNA